MRAGGPRSNFLSVGMGRKPKRTITNRLHDSPQVWALALAGWSAGLLARMGG